jgi:hypothetical protein
MERLFTLARRQRRLDPPMLKVELLAPMGMRCLLIQAKAFKDRWRRLQASV